jgi:hypothetical protein
MAKTTMAAQNDDRKRKQFRGQDKETTTTDDQNRAEQEGNEKIGRGNIGVAGCWEEWAQTCSSVLWNVWGLSNRSARRTARPFAAGRVNAD